LSSAAVRAVEAGGDIVLVAHGYDNVVSVINSIKEAVKNGTISEDRINQSVYRILKLKQKYNLKDEEVKAPNINEINARISGVLSSYMK
jgi:beta-N-acetylhexosaminidase